MVKWINYIPLKDSLDNFEKTFNVNLPNDLKDIINKFNKGLPVPNKFILADGTKVEFGQMLSFNRNEVFSVYNSFMDEMKERSLIPFAMTKNSSFICLKNNQVVLYNSQYDSEKEVCSSVSELLNMLQED
ncbi:MAG: SMI1/KNR4 family protein [Spirochaetia bacterium]|nr:SMI1/KNR4 family protein [Spirochaetia bacterium]